MVATAPSVNLKAPIMEKYELIKEDMIDEYGAKVLMFKHKKTGAEIMSVSVPDENKVGTSAQESPITNTRKSSCIRFLTTTTHLDHYFRISAW